LIASLLREGLSATKIASQGGFLRRGSVTILSGVEDEQVETVLELARRECRSRLEKVAAHALPVFTEVNVTQVLEPVEVHVGGAAVFILNVERFERM
jgi:uncharacterized protein YaaQ